MSRRILVTGATGFVGSHLAESLLEAGNMVRLLVRDPSRLKWFSPAQYEIVTGGFSDVNVLRTAVQDVDAVIHCAGVTKTARPDEFFQINEVATRDLCREAERAGVRRFVHCSTLAVCGPSLPGRVIRESDEARPITNYGRSKLAGEIAVREECKSTDWVIMRPPAVIGPRDEQFVPLFSMLSKWRVNTDIWRSKRLYSIVGVHDLVRALSLVAVIDKGLRQTYLVAIQTPYLWSAVAESFEHLTGRKVLQLPTPEFVSRLIGIAGDLSMKITGKAALLSSEKVREILADGWACDTSSIEIAWNFHCQDSLDDVVRMTYEFYRDQHWI